VEALKIFEGELRRVRGLSMMRVMLAALAGCALYGQTFEAASIKQSAPPAGAPPIRQCKGGPGTADPGLFVCTRWSIGNLLMTAFGLHEWQFPYADSLSTPLYEFSARIPPGSSQVEFNRMLQNFFAERFRLQYHFEKRELPVYDLTIAKGGLKMKPSTTAEERSHAGTVDGRETWTVSGAAMDEIVQSLTVHMGGPVTDSTGLAGRYDFTLAWARSDGPSERAQAIAEQLGLKLERKKALLDVFVIDHIEKIPIGN
jgi:uncharacterized protein (TIGR03435 family)